MQTEYTFVIDTNKYAGNFERNMCAFLTGITADYGVGTTEAKKFEKRFGKEKVDEMERYVEFRYEDGWERPTIMYLTPSKYKCEDYCSVAIFFYIKPSKEIIEIMRQRAEEFTQDKSQSWNKKESIKILGFRLIKRTTTCKVEEIEI